MHTTPTSLESISSDFLLSVSGGCHKQRCCCPAPAPAMQQQIIQMPAPAPAPPQILPQAAPPAPSGPTGDIVSTSVSINGQPAG